MKKLISVLLALVMILSMTATAFADESYEITIKNDVSGYKYSAYQIFDGDYDADLNQLTNITWGSGIDSAKVDALMSELKGIEAFSDCENVVDVAHALGQISTKDHETTIAFGDVVAKYLSGTAKESEFSTDKYVISVPEAGYYLVKNLSVPTGSGDIEITDTTYTRYILEVVKDVTVDHKGEFPSVTKKILETNGTDANEEDATTAEIGETVTFTFTGTLPSNIKDYDTYYYVFTDTMSDGLTYTNNLSVTVNGADVTKYFYSGTTGTTTLTVGIQDILALKNIADLDPNTAGNQTVGDITASTTVVVTYTALVNEDAEIGVDGETNKVKLTYSNDPNNDGDGTTTPPNPNPPVPTPTTPVGVTPESVVKVFSTKVEITKIDGNLGTVLTGAKFKISGLSSKVCVVNEEMFVEDANGTYYRLKDGTYTTTAPVMADDETTENINEKTSDSYDDPTKKYKKVEVVSTETITEPFVAEGWVNDQGVITFTGLGEGEYTITELEAPNGYNKLENPIKVVIKSNADELTINTGLEQVTWTADQDGVESTPNNDAWTVENGIVLIEVENTFGATLPSTGGMGTTLIYLIGGIMVLAAVVLLVTKKRMSTVE